MSLIKNNPYYQKPEVAGKFQGYTQAAAGISSLLPEESNPYSYDKFSSLKGASQGAQLGATFGPVGALVGAGIGGIAGGVGEAINQAKELDRTQTSFDTIDYDQHGQPVFQGGQLAQGITNLNNISGAYNKTKFGDFNRNKMKNTRNKLSAGIEDSQNQFNQANIAYNQNFLARQQYEDQLKKNNIYNFPMQLV